jgi:PAS domain S-box-containing protein
VLPDLRFTFANAEALRILRMKEEDIEKKLLSDFASMTIREDGSPHPVEEYGAVLALKTGESVGPRTIGLRYPNGRVVWCVWKTTPVKDPETGATTGAILGFLDVTEQFNVARSLRDHRAKLAAIMASAPNIIFTITPEGRFLFVNRAIHDLLGVDPATLIGESIFDRLNSRDRELVREKIRHVIERGENAQYEMTGLDGRDTNSYMVNLGPIWRDGKVASIVGIKSVITELKRAEADRIRLVAELHEAQRLEGLGRLAGGVAHDFNNLLTIVQTNVDLLLSERSEYQIPGKNGSAQKIRERVGEIGDAARRAAALTRQLLAFGRKQELLPRTIDVGVLVRGVTPLLRRLVAEHTRLDVVANSTAGAVFADPIELERVLVNLVMNAADATPHGGVITISTRSLWLDAPREGLSKGPHVVLEVRDTGTGMGEETLAHAFEPFFTTKALGRGTGLGLATVHGIVRQSGGTIEIESHVGAGTTVRVLLPATRMEVAPTSLGSPPPRPTSRRSTVLLVEDEHGVRESTRLVLEANGYEVIAPASALAASTVSGDTLARIDLLLTDVVMPDISGTTLAARLRERSPHLPVLLMSGHTRVNISAATDGYRLIMKPFDERSLIKAVRAALAVDIQEAAQL